MESSSYQSNSDPDSDALVVQGLVAAGQDPGSTTWSNTKGSAVADLPTFQDAATGGYFFDKGTPSPSAFTTSEVIGGLVLKPFPIHPTYTAGRSLPAAGCPSAAAIGASPSPAALKLPPAGAAPVGESLPVGLLALLAVGLATSVAGGGPAQVSRRGLLAAFAAPALAVGGLALAPAGPGRPTCAAAAGAHHVAVVVRHADGTAFDAPGVCVSFTQATITVEFALQLAAAHAALATWWKITTAAWGTSCCQVDAEPAPPPEGWTTSNCFQQGGYWEIFTARQGGAWRSTQSGISNATYRMVTPPVSAISRTPGHWRPAAWGICPAALASPAPATPATAAPRQTATSHPPRRQPRPRAPCGGAVCLACRGGRNRDRCAVAGGTGREPQACARVAPGAPFARLDWRRHRIARGGADGGLAGRAPRPVGARMNVRAVAAWCAAALLIALVTNNPVYRVLVLLAALNLLAARRRQGTRLRPVLLGIVVATVIALGINVLLSHGGVHVLARVPDAVPGFGGPLTLEAAAFGLAIGVGLAAAVAAAAALPMLSDATELIDALPAALHRTGAALAMTLGLVPGLWHSFVAVREAQLLRGVRMRGVRGIRYVMVPVTLTAMERSLQLAEAMDARAFGSGPRTRAYAAPWSLADRATVVAAAVAAVLFVGLRGAGLAADWKVFPALSTPAVSPLAVLACALLLTPALLPKRWRA